MGLRKIISKIKHDFVDDKLLFWVSCVCATFDSNNLNLLFVGYFALREQENVPGYEGMRGALSLILAPGTSRDVVLDPCIRAT